VQKISDVVIKFSSGYFSIPPWPFFGPFFGLLSLEFKYYYSSFCWPKNCLVKKGGYLEFVTGGVELLKAVLHGYAGGLIFMK